MASGVSVFAVGCVLVCGMAAAAQQPRAGDWKPVAGRIMTRWAKDVTPTSPLPEYPRPTMVRAKWQNLNGLWSYAIVNGAGGERPAAADGNILVPFPVESALSGVAKGLSPEQTLWYWRDFAVPSEWRQNAGRVLLHFGAVDWHARVRVNGKELGEHKGGFDGFSFDITDALKDGENRLEVWVQDRTDTGGQPRGKQWLKPHGIWYTPTSGIWQTVWLEPVPAASISAVKIRGSAAAATATVSVALSGAPAGHSVEVELLDAGASVGRLRAEGAGELSIKIPNAKAWSPSNPFLYDVAVRVLVGGKVVDEVKSYVGLRDITVGPDTHGVTRLLLNGVALFQYGPLDQGFWPDGLYTAPTDAALKFDIEAVQRMGGNMLRKHVKVEPERFYSWCDRMGVLVWQDMPSPFFRNERDEGVQPMVAAEWKTNFEAEMREMVRERGNHPSIVMWVPFNEGWGQNDIEWAKSMALKVKEWDATRLVNNASGWTDMKVGDTFDLHLYPGPGLVRPESARAGVLGEFGGLGLPIDGHTWVGKDNWGYVSYKTKEELTGAYAEMLKRMPMLIGQGLSAAVYTQTTDVEIEVNGWLTYDREIWKIDPDRAKAATMPLYAPPPVVRTLVPHAGDEGGIAWRYTTDKPADTWFTPAFDDTAWRRGDSGFGREGTPGASIRTKWESADIWIRRDFQLDTVPAQAHLAIHHDEDAHVYINGELAVDLKGYTTGYQVIPLEPKAASLLKKGRNTIAVHCHQTSGGQYIDVGLVDIVPSR
jgi:hypothetical protein